MSISFEIYEHDHFHIEWEDMRNGLYFTVLNDDVGSWLKENLAGNYDVNCDDYLNDIDCDYLIIEFTNEEDAVAFKLRWL